MPIKVDKVVDAKGLACPMPIVRTKKTLEELTSGQVLELRSTDKGSLADIKSWSKTTGHQYLGSTRSDRMEGHCFNIQPVYSPGHTIGSTSLIVTINTYFREI